MREATAAVERVAGLLGEHRQGSVVVVTGAGISHASGIPTFRGRDEGAIWRASDIETATLAFFRADPVAQWRWYLERFAALEAARPNPAHRALVELEAWQGTGGGAHLLVTQNIDTLHEDAGSRKIIKVHGTSDRVRCASSRCDLAEPAGSLPRSQVDIQRFAADPGPETLPRCPQCGDLLRAHVLFFDEYYTSHADYRFAEVEDAAQTADLILFVGTSFSVGVTDLFVRAGVRRGIPLMAIDPSPLTHAVTELGIEHIALTAEAVLPDVVARISP